MIIILYSSKLFIKQTILAFINNQPNKINNNINKAQYKNEKLSLIEKVS